VSRPPVTYADVAQTMRRVFAGTDVSQPVAGFYRFRLRSGGIRGVVRIHYGPPCDPLTGEELDRSHRWMAHFNGELIEFDRAWPQCCGEPVDEAEYRIACGRQEWARKHAPDSSYADPRKRRDPLDPSEPLPF
jgi:hypothetical protein